ncbi:hypothetical protein [Rossellomorea sp. YZS02]|nr:hypothetical protein [Rossellomorea sp. YZS02]MDX8344168.1 hypothetical protein [Rossellomorea sp. YZS02]
MHSNKKEEFPEKEIVTEKKDNTQSSNKVIELLLQHAKGSFD